MAKMIGSINCYISTTAHFNGKPVVYDGTTLDLVRKLVVLGGKPEDTFVDSEGRTRKILAHGGGDREGTNGWWVTQWNVNN